MSIFKKKTDETLAAERMPYADDGSTGTMADVEAVMKNTTASPTSAFGREHPGMWSWACWPCFLCSASP